MKVTRTKMYVFFGSKTGTKEYPLDEVVALIVKEYDVMNTMKPFKWELKL